jgi:hypothetical protein
VLIRRLSPQSSGCIWGTQRAGQKAWPSRPVKLAEAPGWPSWLVWGTPMPSVDVAVCGIDLLDGNSSSRLACAGKVGKETSGTRALPFLLTRRIILN